MFIAIRNILIKGIQASTFDTKKVRITCNKNLTSACPCLMTLSVISAKYTYIKLFKFISSIKIYIPEVFLLPIAFDVRYSTALSIYYKKCVSVCHTIWLCFDHHHPLCVISTTMHDFLLLLPFPLRYIQADNFIYRFSLSCKT